MTSKAKPATATAAVPPPDASTCLIREEDVPVALIDSWHAWAAVLVRFNNVLLKGYPGDVKLTSVQLCEPKDGEGILMIAKGTKGKRRVKGFSRSANVAEGIQTLMDRIDGEDIDWRDDLPYSESKASSNGSTVALGTPPAV